MPTNFRNDGEDDLPKRAGKTGTHRCQDGETLLDDLRRPACHLQSLVVPCPSVALVVPV